MKKLLLFFLILINAQLLFAEEIESESYEYKGNKYRDPFISVISEAGSSAEFLKGKIKIDLNALQLKGIFFSKNKKYAIMTDLSGKRTFFIKQGRMYDIYNKLVEGIAGIVERKKVILITETNVIKEFKIIKEENK